MNKEEINKRVRLLKVEVETINTMLENFETQLAEAEKLEKLDKLLEKPKLQLGDFGITTRESVDELDKFVVIEIPKGNLEPLYQNGQTDGYLYAKKHPEDYTIFGNIFDLMKGWDKPFVDYEKKSTFKEGYYDVFFKVNIAGSSRINLSISSPGGIYSTFTIEDAEEIHSKLGHAIAELKQKKETE